MTIVASLAEVDICNMSLSHLSLSQTVQSIDPPDNSPQAQACAFWYPKMRNWLLRMAPWNFADVNQALPTDTTTYPGWPYGYQYPADCLQLIAVTTQYGLRYGAQYWSNFWTNFAGLPYLGFLPKVPSKVVQSTMSQGNKAILCDLPPTAPVFGLYIQCVTNTQLFDPVFSDCLSFYVASRVGGPLRANLQKVAAAAEAAQMMRLQALAQCINESQQDPERVSPSISARG